MKLLKGAGLTLNLQKCSIFSVTVGYLGRVIASSKSNVASKITKATKALQYLIINEIGTWIFPLFVYRLSTLRLNFGKIGLLFKQEVEEKRAFKVWRLRRETEYSERFNKESNYATSTGDATGKLSIHN